MTLQGMYRVHDPAAPKLAVGRFTILSQKPGWLWIQDGEEGLEIHWPEFMQLFGITRFEHLLTELTEESLGEFYRERF